MTEARRTRLAVWGDPIAHSKSPALHAAAYEVLGLDWEYGRRQVSRDAFASTLAGLDDSWRGLSITMPLKEEAYRAADHRDAHAELTGAVNTLSWQSGLSGYNTDVGGIVDALAEAGVAEIATARIVGAGATAASALVAAHECGAKQIDIVARRPEAARALVALAERIGIAATQHAFGDALPATDLTLATLPSGTVLDAAHSDRLTDAGGALFEAAYAPWPSALAAAWPNPQVVSGLAMLLHQAVRQIRVFLNGDPAHPLDDEAAVVGVMRAAIMGD